MGKHFPLAKRRCVFDLAALPQASVRLDFSHATHSLLFPMKKLTLLPIKPRAAAATFCEPARRPRFARGLLFAAASAVMLPVALEATVKDDFLSTQQRIISVNWLAENNSDGQISNDRTAGVLPVRGVNWNQYSTALTGSGLKDQSGSATSVGITWSGRNGLGLNGRYRSDGSQNTGNGQLTKGYIDDGGSGYPVITFSDLPGFLSSATTLDVYVIVAGDSGGGTKNFAPVKINGTYYTSTAAGSTVTGDSAWSAQKYADGNLAEGVSGSYLHATLNTSAIVGGSLQILADKNPSSSRRNIAGVQLACEVLDPSTLADFYHWMGGASGTWDAVATNWKLDGAGADLVWNPAGTANGLVAVFTSDANVSLTGTLAAKGLWVQGGDVVLGGAGTLAMEGSRLIAVDAGSLTLSGTVTGNLTVKIAANAQVNITNSSTLGIANFSNLGMLNITRDAGNPYAFGGISGAGVLSLGSVSTVVNASQALTLAGLTGTGKLSSTSNNLTIGQGNANSSFSGVIDGNSLVLYKVGTGKLELAGTANTHIQTRISAGTVSFSKADALGKNIHALTADFQIENNPANALYMRVGSTLEFMGTDRAEFIGRINIESPVAGTVTFNVVNPDAALTVHNIFIGYNANWDRMLTKTGPGTLILGASVSAGEDHNNWAAFEITEGVLEFAKAKNAATNILHARGGTVHFTGASTGQINPSATNKVVVYAPAATLSLDGSDQSAPPTTVEAGTFTNTSPRTGLPASALGSYRTQEANGRVGFDFRKTTAGVMTIEGVTVGTGGADVTGGRIVAFSFEAGVINFKDDGLAQGRLYSSAPLKILSANAWFGGTGQLDAYIDLTNTYPVNIGGSLDAKPGTIAFMRDDTSYIGTINIAGGHAFQWGIGGAVGSTPSANIVIADAGILAFNRSNNLTFDQPLSKDAPGANAWIEQRGGGAVTLDGDYGAFSARVVMGTLINSRSIGHTVVDEGIFENRGQAGALTVTGGQAFNHAGISGNVSVTDGVFTNHANVSGDVTVAGGKVLNESRIFGTTTVDGGRVLNQGAADRVFINAGGVFRLENGSTGTMGINSGGVLELASGSMGSIGFDTDSAIAFDLSAGVVPSAVNVSFLGDAVADFSLMLDRLTSGARIPLFDYAGSLNNPSRLSINNASYYRPTLTLDFSEPHKIYLNVAAGSVSENLVWNGAGAADAWNLTAQNWQLAGTTTPDSFHYGDHVLFDDTASAKAVILEAGKYLAQNVTVRNSVGNDYSLEGPGEIVGLTSLTKEGSGKLSVSNANSYRGGTFILSGELWMENLAALGTGDIYLGGGGALVVTPLGFRQNVIVLDGETGGLRLQVDERYPVPFYGKGTLNLLGDGNAASTRYFTALNNAFEGTIVVGRGNFVFAGNAANWGKADISANDTTAGGGTYLRFTGIGTTKVHGLVNIANANIVLSGATVVDIVGEPGVGGRLSLQSGSSDDVRVEAPVVVGGNTAGLTSSSGKLIIDTNGRNVVFNTARLVDSANGALTVIKEGAGRVSGVSMDYTGGLIVNGGEYVLSIGGWRNVAGNDVTINNGAVFTMEGASDIGVGTDGVPSGTVLRTRWNINEGGLLYVGGTTARAGISYGHVTLRGGQLVLDVRNSSQGTNDWNNTFTQDVVVDGDVTSLVTYWSQGPNTAWDVFNLCQNNGGTSGRNGTTTFDVKRDALDGSPGLIVETRLNRNTSGAGNLRKIGPGTMVLTNSLNSYGNTSIDEGTLQVGYAGQTTVKNNQGLVETHSHNSSSGSLGASGTTVTIASGANLIIDLSAGSFGQTFSGAGNLEKRASSYSGGDVTLSNASALTGNIAVRRGGLLLTAASPMTLSGNIEVENGAWLKITGNTNLSKANSTSYAGHTLGALFSGSGGHDVDSKLIVSNGHTLRVGGVSTVEELSVAGLELNGAKLQFYYGEGDGAGTDVINVGGALTLTDVNVIALGDGVNPTAWVNGEVTLIKTTGTVTLADIENHLQLDITGITNPEMSVLTLKPDLSGKNVMLQVAVATDVLTWSDTADGRWAVSDGYRWLSQNTGVNVEYVQNDGTIAVRFDDMNSISRNVVMTQSLAPFSVTFAGVDTYTLTNGTGGKLEGLAALNKTGNGLLILRSEDGSLNEFSRNVTVSGGVLELTGDYKLMGDEGVFNSSNVLQNVAAAASLMGASSAKYPFAISNGATLRFNGNVGNATSSNRTFRVGTGGGILEIASTGADTRVWFQGTANRELAHSGVGARSLTLAGAGGQDGFTVDATGRATAISGTTAGGIMALAMGDGGSTAPLTIEKTGTGVWHLTGNNTFTGGVVLHEGLLAVSAGSALGATTAPLVFNGGSLVNAVHSADGSTLLDGVADNFTIAHPVSAEGGGGFLVLDGGVGKNSLTLSGTISGTGTFGKSGAGILHLTANSNAFTGGVHIHDGQVVARHQYALGRSLVTVEPSSSGGAGLVLGAANVVVGVLAGSGIVETGITTQSQLTFDAPVNVTADFQGTLRDGTGPLRLVKLGFGTQRLSGANTYSGGTQVGVLTGTVTQDGGTLRLGHLDALGDSAASTSIISGVLDIAGLDFSATQREVSLDGTSASIADSCGSYTQGSGTSVFPHLQLNTDGIARGDGTTAFSAVNGQHQLSLMALAGAVNAPVFTVTETSTLDVGSFFVRAGATLCIEGTERINASVGLRFDGGTLLLGAGVMQTVSDVSSTGSLGVVRGYGTLLLNGSAPGLPVKEFGVELQEVANLTLNSGSLQLTLPASTSGVISAANYSTLLIPVAVDPLQDVFGQARLALDNGTVQFTAGGDVRHDLIFRGAEGHLRATGTADLSIEGSLFYGASVASYNFYLEGESQAVNTLSVSLFDPVWSVGSLSLTKSGQGVWVLGGAGVTNIYTGVTTVLQGTLRLGSDDAVPATSTVSLGSAGTAGVLDLAGHNLRLTHLGASARAGNALVNSDGVSPVPVFTWVVNEAQSFTGDLGQGTGRQFDFVKTGSAVLSLHGSSNYRGDTYVREGLLELTTEASRPKGQLLSVSPGAQVDVRQVVRGLHLAPGQTLAAGSGDTTSTWDLLGDCVLEGGGIVVGDASSLAALESSHVLRINGVLAITQDSHIGFALDTAPGGSSSVIKANILQVDAAVRLDLTLAGPFLLPGTYTLIEYSGFSGDFTNFHYEASAVDPRYTFSILDNSAVSRLQLVVDSVTAGVGVRVWDGSAGNTWNTADAYFLQGGVPVAYENGAAVIFNDSASAFNISVQDAVIGGVTFNSSQDYTVGGAPISGEGYIEKRGTGSLTLTSENSYRGELDPNTSERKAATVLAQGTLILGHDKALGPDALLITGGILTTDGVPLRALANEVVFASSAVGTLATDVSSTLSLSGILRTQGSGVAVLQKTGDGTLQLGGDASGFHGNLNVSAGRILLRNSIDLSGALLQLDAGATLELSGSVGALTSRLGALVGEQSSIVRSSLAGTATLEVGALGQDSTFSGTFESSANTLSIVKTGNGVLILSGDNSGLAGTVTVSQGTLQVGDGRDGSMLAGSIDIASGARFVLNIADNVSLAQLVSSQGVFEKRTENELEILSPNDLLNGTFLISEGLVVVDAAGTLGHAAIENNARLDMRRDDSYAFDNNISGAGVLSKNGRGIATYFGSHTGTGQTILAAGSLQFGDTARVFNQQHLASVATEAGTTLRFAPATGGMLKVGSVTGQGYLEKVGGGVAQLIGLVQLHNAANHVDIEVREGTLSFGDGDGRTGRPALTVESTINVLGAGTLMVARSGITTLRQTLSSVGLIEARGDNNGNAHLVLASPDNQISGTMNVRRSAIVQVGDVAAPGSLNGAAGTLPIAVTLDQYAVLRFTNPVSGETGSSLQLSSTELGNGTLEYNGGGTLLFNSQVTGAGNEFTGTLRSAFGTLVVDLDTLPRTLTLDAVGSGNLFLGASQDTVLNVNLGDGNGVVTLGVKDAAAPLKYELAGERSFNGTLAVGAHATLHLVDGFAAANDSQAWASPGLTAKTFLVNSGASLTGSGTIKGNLLNALGAVFHPGDDGLGRVNVSGNFYNDGALVVALLGADSYSTVHYTGSAVLGSTSSLNIKVTRQTFDLLSAGQDLHFLRDEDLNDGLQTVLGNFSQENISLLITDEYGSVLETRTGSCLSYNAGDGGLHLMFANSLSSIPGVHLHKGLKDYERYVNDLLQGRFPVPAGDSNPVTIVSGLLGADNVNRAFNAASPAGLASMAAMPIAMAHDTSDTLSEHLEAMRFSRPMTANHETPQPYIAGTGSFVRNGSGSENPAFNHQTYGAIVGLDQFLGSQWLAGLAVGYSHGNADMAYQAGRVAQDSMRAAIYSTYMLADRWYVEASLSGGYSHYSVKQQALSFGTAKASPDGFDFGGSISTGAIFSLNNRVHFTPHVGLEYVYASVESFSEKGNAADLCVEGFHQDSLQARVGFGVSWLVPTMADFTLRLAFDFSLSHELLDPDVQLQARFRSDTTGNSFRSELPSVAETMLKLGPTIDVGLTQNISLSLSYRLGYDLEKQQAHHVNAGFRVRF